MIARTGFGFREFERTAVFLTCSVKQQILQYVFAKKCKNSGRRISGITEHLKLVTNLSESELTDGSVWQQSKLVL